MIKMSLWISLALFLSGCEYDIWDLHFGPNPGDGVEEINIEDQHEKTIEKNYC